MAAAFSQLGNLAQLGTNLANGGGLSQLAGFANGAGGLSQLAGLANGASGLTQLAGLAGGGSAGGLGNIISQIKTGIQNPSASANVFIQRFLNVGIGLLLNGSIEVEELKSLPRVNLYSAEQLWCDFSQPCHWRSEGLGGTTWKWAPYLPDSLHVLAVTQTLALPTKPPFVFLHANGAPGDKLVSSVIECQNGHGIVQFQYWKTTDIVLRICQKDLYGRLNLFCHDLQTGNRVAGIATIQLPEANQPFKIAISGVGEGFLALDSIQYAGNLCRPTEPPPTTTTALQVFTEDPDPWPIEKQQKRTAGGGPFFDRRTADFVTDTNQLTCDTFDDTSDWPCLWGSGQWRPIIRNSPGLPRGLEFPAVFHSSHPDLPDNHLASDPMWCTQNEGQVLFNYWLSGPTAIRVCASEFGTGTPLHCSPLYNASHPQYPGPVSVQMPKIVLPFELRFEAIYGPTTPALAQYAIIDDIAYFAEICTAPLPVGEDGGILLTQQPPPPAITPPSVQLITAGWTPNDYDGSDNNNGIFSNYGGTEDFFTPLPPTTTTTPTTTTPSTTTLVQWTRLPRVNPVTSFTPAVPTVINYTERPKAPNYRASIICEELNCDFEDGYCGYRQGSFHHTTFWSRRMIGFGRPISRLTDVQTNSNTGYYLGALLKRNSAYSVAVIESPSFHLGRISYLRFHLYSAGLSTAVKVCFDSALDDPVDGRRYLSTLRRCRDVLKHVDQGNLRRWNSVRLLMIPGFTKFFIVAEHDGASNEYVAVGVDNVNVSPCL